MNKLKFPPIDKILFSFFPLLLNIFIKNFIMGESVTWSKGGPVSNRILSGLFSLIVLGGFIWFFFDNKDELKKNSKTLNIVFIISFLTCVFFHYKYFINNDLPFSLLIGSYIILFIIQILVTRNFKDLF